MADAKKRGADGLATFGVIAGGLALLLVLYVASIGPMILICDSHHRRGRCDSIEPALRVFYTPILWLHEETPLEGAIDWYVELWGG